MNDNVIVDVQIEDVSPFARSIVIAAGCPRESYAKTLSTNA